MKRELLDILVCPVCKGPLGLTVEEENEREIVTGTLSCPRCNVSYPIVDTIPNLLPPEAVNRGDSSRRSGETPKPRPR